MYKFNLPIGDWSNDGHGKCKYYLVESNKPVEEVREAHYRIEKVTGIDIHKVASYYEENYINSREVIQAIIDTGFDLINNCNEFDEEDDYCSFDSYNMASLWLHLLMCVDKDLELKMATENKVDMLPFYGFDKKGRHIGFVGYGVFY